MPESKRNAFLGAFSKLKQYVLWKWESDTLPGEPSNVKLGKWLPQSDILVSVATLVRPLGYHAYETVFFGGSGCEFHWLIFSDTFYLVDLYGRFG